MCNMAAYAGSEPAAAKLFRMLQSQEYLGGGHYTGIATVFENKIYMRKVIGTTADLLKRYPDVLDLPGCVGIAHSRTPGYDSDEWAQPFFAHGEKVIYCANGAAGKFKDTCYQSAYDSLQALGVKLRTARRESESLYPVMSDGFCVHSSEIFANLIALEHLKGARLLHAMHHTAVDYPAEIAALALSVNEPETVSALRINQPLMCGKDANGFYLATSAFALENEKLDWINRIPHCSTLAMNRKSIEFECIDELLPRFMEYEPLTEIFAEYEAMLASNADYDVDKFCKAAARHFPADKIAVANMIAYEFLREKVHAGALEFFDITVSGSGKGLSAPQRRFRRRKH